jgi:putative restriction endonuclease
MAHLSVLVAEFGEDVPYAGGLERGFPFRGRRVPFLNRQKGSIARPFSAAPSALSIQTSARSPYDDEAVEDGFLYAYRAGSIDQPDNRSLRAAYRDQVLLVYFIGTRPGWYKPVFQCFVRADDPAAQMVLVTPGALSGSADEPEPIQLEDPIERRYAVRQTRVRLHQARFRGRCRAGVQRPVRDLPTEGAAVARRRPHPQRLRGERRADDSERSQHLCNPSPCVRSAPRRRLT